LPDHFKRPDVAVIAIPVEVIERVWSNNKTADTLVESDGMVKVQCQISEGC